MKRILLIGAGAVGISYGQAMQRAGNEVFYYVRAKYRDELKDGIPIHHLNRIPQRRVELFKNFGLLTTLDEVRARSWDQVWLCMSSTALKGDWLKPMLVAIGNATLVALQPGLNNEAWLASRYPATKTCWGLITFIAWQSPLPGEDLSPKGMALYHPPFSASPFSGHSQFEISADLNSGGLPAKTGKNIGQAAALPSSILLTHIAALEGAGWSFSGFRAGSWSKLAAEAAREALSISGEVSGQWPWMRPFVRAFVGRLATRLAPRLMPFDIENYLAWHFTKVGDQTRAGLRELIHHGKKRQLPVEALSKLHELVFAQSSKDDFTISDEASGSDSELSTVKISS